MTMKASSPAADDLARTEKKISVSNVLAGQKRGRKDVDDGIWLVAFLTCNLG